MSVPRTNPSPVRPQLPTNAILHERFHPRARPNPTEPSRPSILCTPPMPAPSPTAQPEPGPTADAPPYHTNNFTPVHIRTRRSHPSLGNAHSKPHERIPHPAQTNPTFPPISCNLPCLQLLPEPAGSPTQAPAPTPPVPSPSALAPLGLPARRGTWSTIPGSTPKSLPSRQSRARTAQGTGRMNPSTASSWHSHVRTGAGPRASCGPGGNLLGRVGPIVGSAWVASTRLRAQPDGVTAPCSSWRARSPKSSAITSNSRAKPVSR